ncbi:hypothetical protein KR018_007545 [Drosophila ironensis]|nr:hypothetical protein KR018_007545 [Drosophila ironensis]
MVSKEGLIEISKQVCRVCLEVHEDTLSLTDEIEYNQQNKEIWQMLETICKMDVSICEYITALQLKKNFLCTQCHWTDSNLPTQLCQNCTRRLISSYEFILEVEGAQQTLQSLDLRQTVNTTSDRCQLLPAVYEELHVALGEEEVATEADDTLIIGENEVDSETEWATVSVPTGTNSATRDRSQLGSRLACSENVANKCEICPRAFATEESLSRHVQLAHSQVASSAAQELASEDGNTGLVCAHCPRSFKRSDTLWRHMKAFHPEAASNQSSDLLNRFTKKRAAKRRECPHCGISFPASSITVHIRRHTGENPYKCNHCERAFPRSQDLNLHIRQHTGERPSQCKICSKTFISTNKLSRHMRLHTGQRPYACNLCTKTFVQSNDLKIHIRRHTGERPYTCGVCGSSFICGSLLNIHRNQKGHHEPDKQPPDCNSEPYVNTRVNQRRAEDIERMRLQRAPETPTHAGVVPLPQKPELSYNCGVCGGTFKTGALLTIHRNNFSHHEHELTPAK